MDTLYPTSSRRRASAYSPQVRVLIIPGLRDSGEAHWQTWLQTQYHDAVRVKQADWHTPDLAAWAEQITRTIERHGPHIQWVAVAHSFGCLALTHHLAQFAHTGHSIASALMVAPADPVKFQIEDQLPTHSLGIPATVIGSQDDPWMPLERARHWAERWGTRFHNLGNVGHINTESGFGPWPLARIKVDQLVRQEQLRLRMNRGHASAGEEDTFYPPPIRFPHLSTNHQHHHTNHAKGPDHG